MVENVACGERGKQERESENWNDRAKNREQY
jgi:hypothetical protein